MLSDRVSNHPYPSGKFASEVDYHWQGGFTLLELIVAMAIFAMLAVAGWQVFDSINRSKERAQLQSAVLTDLQYGYQQIQRDMMQTVAYQLPQSGGESDTTASNDGGRLNGNDDSLGASEQSPVQPELTSGFSLESNQLSFIRHADPDPRYQQAANLEKIVYTFNDGNLIRQRYTSLNSNSNERPLTSVIISGVDAGQFQVLMPEPSSVFPATDSTAKDSATNVPFSAQLTAPNGGQSLTAAAAMLPRGVSVAFTLPMGNIVTPVSWVYALAKAPPTPSTAGLNPNPDPKPEPEPEPDPEPK